MYKEISIAKNSNAVIHYLIPHLNGGLFDAFEYYSAIYKYNKNVYLLYIYIKNRKELCPYMNTMLDMFRDKYENIEESFSNVIFLDSVKLIKYKFSKVLFVDNHTYSYLKGRILADEYIHLVDPVIPSLINYEEINNKEKHIIYSEMKFYKELEG